MTLAAVLGFCCLILASPHLLTNLGNFTPQAMRQASEQSTATGAPTQSTQGQAQQSPASAPKTPSHKNSRHKKTSDCTTAPTPLNTSAAAQPATKNSAASEKTASARVESSSAASNAPASSSAHGQSSTAEPCPPPKKVVRDGGSAEPNVQLTGGTATEQAIHQHSTEQLMSSTEENLKTIAGRQLSSNQQETVNQIKQYMQQSKAAAAEGDLDLAHTLAQKAELLSDELVKP
jgi:hypothetical protein